jgi:predicted MFS family arabinose efflux permease
MHDLLNKKIRVALPTMVMIQSFGTMCGSAGAVVAVQASADLGVKSTSIGIYTAFLYIVAMVSGLAAGGLLARFGVIRTCQGLLLACGGGLVLVAAVPLWPMALAAAVLIGLASGPLNPAGSRILARHSPARWRPLVFSIKQTGTPIGGMLAGLLLPTLMALYDWRIAVAAIALLPLAALFGLQLLRSDLDDDRDPTFPVNLAGIINSLRVIVTDKPLSTLVMAGFLYTFVQMAILTYIVIYLEEANGLPTEFAGGIFAIIHGSAIPARVFWGAIAGRLLSSWVLLGLIGILMSISIVAISFFSPDWPFWLIALVAILLGVSTNGVLGLLLSEFARMAPSNKIGEVAGGGQFFLFFGIVSGPPVFGAIVEFGGGYETAFHLIALLSFLAGFYLLLTRRHGVVS